MSITIDTRDLTSLATALSLAGPKVEREARKALDGAAEDIRAEAAATAASYRQATGALARNVRVTGDGDARQVGSTVREGWYLANGSPNTGGPRPWLDAPAERGAQQLGEELSKIDLL